MTRGAAERQEAKREGTGRKEQGMAPNQVTRSWVVTAGSASIDAQPSNGRLLFQM